MKNWLYALILASVTFAPTAARAGDAITVPAGAATPALPAYLARPTGATAPAPAVVVLHGCEGLNPSGQTHLGQGRYEHVADWLASHGYVAIVIDTLAPTGASNACSPDAGPPAARAEAADAIATLAWLRTQPFVDGARLALLGYSLGGDALLFVVDSPSLTTAPEGLRAAIAYYPDCAQRTPDSLLVPLRILNGGADDWIPAAPCQALASAATAAGKTIVITTYPGAAHAFNFDSPDRTAFGHSIRYDAKAAADAASETLAFLQRYLGSSP